MNPVVSEITRQLLGAVELVEHADNVGPTPKSLSELKHALALLKRAQGALARHITVETMRTRPLDG